MSNVAAPEMFHENDERASMQEKLDDLLSSADSEDELSIGGEADVNSLGDEEEVEVGDILEMDENGRIKDLDMIADVLETKRADNKTFNEFELRDIERKNGILMNKILSSSRRPSQYTVAPIVKKESSSSINRRQKQAQIDRANMILLKKIQSVKPFGQSRNKRS